MKTNKLIYIFLALIILLISYLIIKNIKAPKYELSKYEDYAEYINSFTSGFISKNSEIIIELNSFINWKKQLTEKELNEIIQVVPAIKGKVYWKKDNVIAFKPYEPFTYNKKYFFIFNIKKLLINEIKINDFIFSVYITPQIINFNHYEVETTSQNDYSKQNIYAFLELSNVESMNNIKKCLNVSLNNKPIEFKIDSIDSYNYKIIIENISRTNSPQIVKILCNGNKIGADTKSELNIEIPALEDFKILNIFVNQYPEQSIALVFSDPIDSKQDLGGIIYFTPETILRYTIDKNTVWIYPTDFIVGNYQLNISTALTNTRKKHLKKSTSYAINFQDIKPQVKFADNGFIIPSNSQGSIIPILTMNLKEIDVRIIQIFENNILQFLQTNDYEQNYELQKVGKIIFQNSIPLDVTPLDKNKWKRFNLDISKFVNVCPGCIYSVSIGFRQHQTLLECNKNINISQTIPIESSFDYFSDENEYYDDYYEYEDYQDYWQNRDNPCHKAYYGKSRSIYKNFYASDIALIAKKTPLNEWYIFASDIKTAMPLSGVIIEMYDYQKQLIKKAQTDGDGKAIIKPETTPFFIIAHKNNMKSFLKLSNELALSMNSFDISGEDIKQGIKGYIYGERGVWRPGDSLYFTFMLQEQANPLPSKIPIIFEFYDPFKNLISKQIFSKNNSNIYIFKTSTQPDANTGNYLLQVRVGQSIFTKNVKIETIRPNRLKINLTSPAEILTSTKPIELNLNAEWLHGAKASNLKAQVDVSLKPIKTTFKGYENYIFDDISKKYYPYNTNIFDNHLDKDGKATIITKFDSNNDEPGFMQAIFTTKVYETGGEYSIDQTSFTYSPYESYVGFNIKKDDPNYNMLYTEKEHKINIVTLNHYGKMLNTSIPIEIIMYKLDWRWWWDQSDEYFDFDYKGHSYYKIVKADTIYTKNGSATWSFKIDKSEYGRFLLIVKNLESMHSASSIFYIDWPDWKNRNTTEHEQTSTQLVFTTDKDKYNIDDEVIVSFPGTPNGRALITLENSKGIIQFKWLNTIGGINTYRFKATPDMAPNTYINITLLQSYEQTVNDKPIRLYGLKSISVENPETRLYPIIKAPEQLKSDNTYEITITEKNNREMYYTLAIVDEGLLALTKYKTPNPWEYFYAKEAYMLSQWDIYDYFIKGLAGKLPNVIGIGGDMFEESALEAIEAQKAKRFKPLVIFEGPIHLNKGKTNTHKITIPSYMGEVRIMVVAINKNSFGNFEKKIKVIKPLATFTSLPRVLSTEDEIIMPVSVFSYKKDINNATVSVTCKGPVSIEGSSIQNVKLNYNYSTTTFFKLKVGKNNGLAQIDVITTSGNEKNKEQIQIYVRNPNPFTTETHDFVIEPGKSQVITIKPYGISNLQYSCIEFSSIENLNLEKNIDYLINYPHGCLEQIVSSAFAQLYLPELTDLPPEKIKEINSNINYVIRKIQQYQTYSGGFSYWPGHDDVDDWITSYCGHFLIEAQKQGYVVNQNIISKWKTYQKKASQKWFYKGSSSQYTQAYRLFTLALLGDPDINSMNRLANEKNLYEYAKYPLAAAYSLSGRYKIAQQLLSANNVYLPQNYYYDIYGNELREKAFIALSYTLMKNKLNAFKYIKEISKILSNNNYYTTQSLSFALIACANYLQGEKIRTPMKIEYNINKSAINQIQTTKYFYKLNIPNPNTSNSIHIKNLSNYPIYIQSISKEILPIGSETSLENKLSLNLSYLTKDEKVVDINNIKQTTDLIAKIDVTNKYNQPLTRLALTYTLPSGWEILNDRLLAMSTSENLNYDYKDLRDDKINYYFSLKAGETKTFKIPVNVSFAGKFYHPMIICEDMYNPQIKAQIKGKWINIEKAF